MTTSTRLLYNSKGFINPFCSTCRAYTDHTARPDNPRSQDCQVCGTNQNKPLDAKPCFCNICLVVTPHVPTSAPRPVCVVCDTRYSAQPPADEHGQRLRQAAELELREMHLRHPAKYGNFLPLGGYIAALSADAAPSDVTTSLGV